MEQYKVIDESKWKRSLHCQIFRNSVEPCYCVTFELDITNFLAKIREAKLSLTFSLIFAVSKCANNIEEFRYRFLDGQVVLFDRIHTAFTYLDEDTELFKVVNVKMEDTIESYVFAAAQKAAQQKHILQGRWAMMCFNFHLCHGFLIPIFLIQTPEKRIMLLLCLIGENILNETEERCFLFRFRYIIPLWMVYILGNWRIPCKNT